MKYYVLAIFFSIIAINTCFSKYYENLHISLSPIITQVKASSLNYKASYLNAVGFRSQIGYPIKRWDISIGSNVYYSSKAKRMIFNINDNLTAGNIYLSSFSISPSAKYTLNTKPIKSKWYAYLGAGPQWSIQTAKFKQIDHNQNDSNINSGRKLTLHSYGWEAEIGIRDAEVLTNSTYSIGLLYSRKRSYNISIVDISNRALTRTMAKEDNRRNIYITEIILSVGVTIF